MPGRATAVTGHEIAKIALTPMAAIFLTRDEQFDLRSTARASAWPFAIATPYLLTHAFLI